MDIETLRNHCLAKPQVTEGFPFGDDTLVFKVKGKMFALVNLDGEPGINLKCDPEYAVELRERYPQITPGYHMNKTYWNTVRIDGTLADSFIIKLVDHSYNLVSASKK